MYRTKKSIVLSQTSGQGRRDISISKGVELKVTNEYKHQGRVFVELEVCEGVVMTITESDLKNSGVFHELSPQ